MSSSNLATRIAEQAAARPNKPAIECAGQVLTYRQCWQRVCQLALWLRDRGIQEGDRAGVSLPETPDHALLQFAVAAIGAVYVPLDHRWSDAERKAISDNFSLRILIDQALVPGTLPDAQDFAPVSGQDRDWLVSLSSGSTGKPKGALVTHAQMHERFVTQWVTLGFNTSDRFILVTPLCFGAGRSFSMSTLSAGATLIIAPPPLKPDALIAAVQQSRATATFMVPTLLRRLIDFTEPGELLFPGLRRLLLSGEATRADEATRFRETICPNLIGYYASSEGGGISVLQPDQFANHADSVGQAAYRVVVDIADDEGKPVTADETGRLRYRGPGVTTRTLDSNGTLSGADDDWFYPGDLAARDAQGFIRLRGRGKDMIVRGGINIYPAEVENVLVAFDGVRTAVVIGVASTSRGESIHAFVQGNVDLTALEAFCAENLAPYKRPSKIHIIDDMPKTSANKTDRQALRKLLDDVTH